MTSRFPGTCFEEHTDEYQRKALNALSADKDNRDVVPLHLKGTDFQLRVWAGTAKNILSVKRLRTVRLLPHYNLPKRVGP